MKYRVSEINVNMRPCIPLGPQSAASFLGRELGGGGEPEIVNYGRLVLMNL